MRADQTSDAVVAWGGHAGEVPDVPWDQEVADSYDAATWEMNDPALVAATVDVLAELADGGAALELAIGTGRIGLALRERGVDVHGIELSEPMVARLRSKPGGDRIPVVVGDMATTMLTVRFRLVYLVFNTITNLLTQREQVACFRNAAAHLEPGGSFLIEVGVPRLQRLPEGERFVPFEVTPHHICIDEYDLADQLLVSHHTWFDGDTVRRFDSRHRYAWPAEYDLMAELAGLELAHRWAGWDRSPFTSDSRSHVSVWRRPPD
jgi:SAM-dependent methyltransferase